MTLVRLAFGHQPSVSGGVTETRLMGMALTRAARFAIPRWVLIEGKGVGWSARIAGWYGVSKEGS